MLICVISSCQKELINNSNQKFLTSKTSNYEILHFSTVDEFELKMKSIEKNVFKYGKVYFEQWKKENNITTTFKDINKNIKEEQIENTVLENEELSTILNPDGMVVIENHVFKFDNFRRYIYVNDLKMFIKNNEFDTINALKFNFNADVFEELGYNVQIENEKLGNCKPCATNGNEKEKLKNEYCTFVIADKTDLKFTYKFKEVYQHFGIWRRLLTKFKHWQSAGASTTDDTKFDVFYSYSYTVKSGCETSSATLPFLGFDLFLNRLYKDTGSGKTWLHYSSSKCLHKYKLTSAIYILDLCQSISGANTSMPLIDLSEISNY
jgi:hypothetical protein